jgi:hypothetical protein
MIIKVIPAHSLVPSQLLAMFIQPLPSRAPAEIG